MVNWVPIVAATAAAVPAAALFFVSYGRYDGHFRDNVVFLYFIGGLVLGGFLGFLTLLLYGMVNSLIPVIGLALVYPIAVIAAINRRKWQGDRHAVFNGGAAGLGVAVMLSFSLTYFLLVRPMQAAQALSAEPVDSIPYAFALVPATQAIMLAAGLATIFFGIGLLAGDGVRRRKQFAVALLGTAILIAPSVFQLGYFKDRSWLWLALLLAYGSIFAYYADKKLLTEGLTDEDRRQRRRKKRAEAP